MKSKSIIALLILMGLLALFAFKKQKSEGSSEYLVGIIQTASHPALDRAREGFKRQLAQELPGVQFIEQNAEGIASQAQSIAAAFHANQKLSAVFAIGTPAAQAIANIEKNKPIIIAAVTDPKAAGLIQDNVTGTSDHIDAKKHVELILRLTPKTSRVALVHSLGEANSVAAVSDMQEALKVRGLASLDVGVQQASEISTALLHVLQRADVVWLPNDNLLSSALPLVARITSQNKVPLFVSDPISVERGALASIGVDYTRAGEQSADIAFQVLKNNVSPRSISVQEENDPPSLINRDVASRLAIEVGDD